MAIPIVKTAIQSNSAGFFAVEDIIGLLRASAQGWNRTQKTRERCPSATGIDDYCRSVRNPGTDARSSLKGDSRLLPVRDIARSHAGRSWADPPDLHTSQHRPRNSRDT